MSGDVYNSCVPTEADEHNNTDSVSCTAKIIYVAGNYTFKENDNNKVQCGKCGNEFSRILSHLNNSKECSKDIDIHDFKLCLNKLKKKNQKKLVDTKTGIISGNVSRSTAVVSSKTPKKRVKFASKVNIN